MRLSSIHRLGNSCPRSNWSTADRNSTPGTRTAFRHGWRSNTRNSVHAPATSSCTRSDTRRNTSPDLESVLSDKFFALAKLAVADIDRLQDRLTNLDRRTPQEIQQLYDFKLDHAWIA